MFKIISYLQRGAKPHNKLYAQALFSFATGNSKKPVICYYKLLNVSTKASAEEIKESYYKLGKALIIYFILYNIAKKYHPDTIKEGEKEQSEVTMKIYNFNLGYI